VRRKEASLQASALALAAKGFYVFPIHPRAKKPPLCKHGFQDATTDAEQIRKWWAKTPNANIGLACVLSGIVVIDVDPRDHGSETFAALVAKLGELPGTAETATGGAAGGRHLFFRAPPGAEFRGKLGQGVDVKHNGYVVVPPSIHPSGKPYVAVRSLHDMETTATKRGFATVASAGMRGIRFGLSGAEPS
jgi:hypothetical protein